MTIERFRIGTEIHRTRILGFENRSRKTKVFSKIGESTLSFGTGLAITMVIPTVGCTWALSKSGGCSMCGYINDSTLDETTDPEYYFDIEWQKLQQDPLFPKVKAVKLYNSGSFLDPKEISVSSQKSIVEKIAKFDHIQEFIIECLPEIINAQINVLKELSDIFNSKPIFIGVGLESTNAYILRSYVNKPFTFENQFLKCVENSKKIGVHIKPYLLLKPPFLTEQESIDDAISSIKDSFSAGCKVISLNPVCVHADTLVELLWKKKEYSTPWLWSILKVLEETYEFIPVDGKLICEVMAGGLQRGAHNCGKCDSRVLHEIEYFSLNQKFSPAKGNLICECKQEWLFICQNEKFLARITPFYNHNFNFKDNSQPI
jgi:hypothetical protein